MTQINGIANTLGKLNLLLLVEFAYITFSMKPKLNCYVLFFERFLGKIF